jgi:hypothetical protein
MSLETTLADIIARLRHHLMSGQARLPEFAKGAA